MIHTLKQGWCNEPLFGCEDMICDDHFLTSSCVKGRKFLIMDAMFSITDNSVSKEFWLALKCIFNVPDPDVLPCFPFCPNIACGQAVNIYFAYTKSDAPYLDIGSYDIPYLCYNNNSSTIQLEFKFQVRLICSLILTLV